MVIRVLTLLLVMLLESGCGGRAGESDRAPLDATTSPHVAVGTDPAELAAQLALAERAIRDPKTDTQQLERLGRLQQAATLELVKQRQWRQPTLDLLPADLRDSVAANLEAGASLRAMVKPRQSLPAWKIVAPPPPDELLRYYREAEAQFGVPWAYLAAIHLVETRMGRIRGTSIAGAQGPMQFMPATWAAYGKGDINNSRDAILAAGRYLRASGAPDDMQRALFAYNRSQDYVRAVDLYARQMQANPRTYYGYYHWQVYYLTVNGDVLLQVGYGE